SKVDTGETLFALSKVKTGEAICTQERALVLWVPSASSQERALVLWVPSASSQEGIGALGAECLLSGEGIGALGVAVATLRSTTDMGSLVVRDNSQKLVERGARLGVDTRQTVVSEGSGTVTMCKLDQSSGSGVDLQLTHCHYIPHQPFNLVLVVALEDAGFTVDFGAWRILKGDLSFSFTKVGEKYVLRDDDADGTGGPREEEVGPFDVDLFASEDNRHPAFVCYYWVDGSSFNTDWLGRACYENPPYEHDIILRCLQKAIRDCDSAPACTKFNAKFVVVLRKWETTSWWDPAAQFSVFQEYPVGLPQMDAKLLQLVRHGHPGDAAMKQLVEQGVPLGIAAWQNAASDYHLYFNLTVTIILGILCFMFLCIFLLLLFKRIIHRQAHQVANMDRLDETELADQGRLQARARGPAPAPRGLDATQIAAFPTVEYEESMFEKDDNNCSVCLCDYEAGDTLRKLPSCAERSAQRRLTLARCGQSWPQALVPLHGTGVRTASCQKDSTGADSDTL
ncbi:hypothetical protein CYMTET_34511, partial [Cymbomonas tetramitiformis]